MDASYAPALIKLGGAAALGFAAIGSALGTGGLNIANLSLARNKSEGNALNVIELDTAPSAEIIATLSAAPGILSANAQFNLAVNGRIPVAVTVTLNLNNTTLNELVSPVHGSQSSAAPCVRNSTTLPGPASITI